jgi:heme exporter protein CcmD
MMNFLAMGGYAAFVWPAYGVSVAGIAAAIGLTLRSYKRAKTRAASLNAPQT